MKNWIVIFLSMIFIGGGDMETKHLHWMGHSAFRIEDGSTQIYIDPFKLPADLPKADVILITHGHYDHCSIDDIAKIIKKETIIVIPKTAANEIKGSKIEVEPGKTYNVGNLKVAAVPAYNINKRFHPKQNGWVGYIVTLSNGQRIYHAGDTDFIDEMKNIVTDIALLPCGGTYTMTAKEAAEAANTFKPKLLVPMHWGSIVGSSSDADTVKKMFRGETLILKPE
jgi:L-ascorbate metabolism protein UlaG (beta-lactamase superfamily)